MVRFDLRIELEYEILHESDFIFNIHPVNTAHQRVTWESLVVTPHTEPTLEAADSFGNRHMRIHADPGSLLVQYGAIVDVDHFYEMPHLIEEVPIRALPAETLQYIYPSRYCQSDKLSSIAQHQFAGMPKGYQRVMAICEWVRARTRFQSGATNSLISAYETYQEQVGICRDFAHLMIAICRALNIPARFVTGIDYGADPGLGPTDFHAYVEVFLGDRWYLFDPTGISPHTGLLRIGTGRDASDVSFATIFGTVKSAQPRIRIDVSDDATEGYTVPVHVDYAVSTATSSLIEAPAFGSAIPPVLDRAVAVQHGVAGAEMH